MAVFPAGRVAVECGSAGGLRITVPQRRRGLQKQVPTDFEWTRHPARFTLHPEGCAVGDEGLG
jgi:hypothetical protein